MAGPFDSLAALVLRRIRLLTALVIFGAVWFIAADGASWSGLWIVLLVLVTAAVCAALYAWRGRGNGL